MVTVHPYIAPLILTSSDLPSMDTSLVDRLPPELLLAITTFIIDQNTISRLAAVCRYWRDVFTGTPTLWTSIDSRTEYRTSILLQRSESNPIDVTINRYVPEAISLIVNHSYRMRSIEINLPSRQFEDVRLLLDGLVPILETMRMRPRRDGLPARFFPLHSSFFRGQFPALRTLHLEGYPLDLTRSAPMMTNGLTRLVLDNRQLHHRDNLLEYLGHCRNLVYLRIELPNLVGAMIPALRIVSLPNLRELWLVRSSLAAIHHLYFPPSTDLIIESHGREQIDGHPPVRDRFPQTLESRAIEDIRMTFHVSDCVVVLSGPHFVFTERTRADTSRYNTFYSDYLDSFHPLPITTTEVLRFVQPPQCPFTGILRPQSCVQLLLRTPTLKRIVVDASVAPFFIRALEPVDGQVPCLALQVLVVIRRGGHDVDLRGDLLSLSNQREDHGCPLMCNIEPPGLNLSNRW